MDKIYIPNNDFQLHYHNFETEIICTIRKYITFLFNGK